MLASVIFSNTVWTFWDVMIFFFIWIPAVMIWFFCLFDIFARRDMGIGGKLLWLLAIFIIPWFGGICYLITRSVTATETA
jgi:hypothetical protein